MQSLRSRLGQVLLSMFVFPWQPSRTFKNEPQAMRWLRWIASWIMPVSGMWVGAFIAALLTQRLGSVFAPYVNYIDIGIAILIGTILQFTDVVTDYFSELIAAIGLYLVRERFAAGSLKWMIGWLAALFAGGILGAIPMAIVVAPIVTIYFYAQSLSKVAGTFVVALLIKTLLIPLIKTAVMGVAFKKFLRYLRQDTTKNT